MSDAVLDIASLDSGQESPAVESNEVVETPEASSENESSDASQGNEAAAQSEGKITGKAVRDAVKAASEQFPEQAKLFKQLADSHFRVESAYKQAFGTPQEATQAKQLIDAVGGLDGISQIQERIANYDTQDNLLKEGNPQVLESFFKDFPEGAAALAPKYLETLAKTNFAAYESSVAPHAMYLLQQTGITEFVKSLVNESDPERLSAGIKSLNKWFGDQTQTVKQIVEKNNSRFQQENPIAKEREALNTEKEQLFRQSVNEKIDSACLPVLNSEISKYVKQYKLNDVQAKKFEKELLDTVKTQMNEDASYKKQVDLRYTNKNRTKESVASYISGEFNRRVKDQAFEVAKSIWGNPRTAAQKSNDSGVVKAETPKTASDGGPIQVTRQPKDDEIDWNKPNAELNFIKKKAYLKGSGRFVQWP